MWEVPRADHCADFKNLLQVGFGASAVNNAGKDALEPRATFATRRAFATRFMRIKVRERECCSRNVGGGIHHHDCAGTKH